MSEERIYGRIHAVFSEPVPLVREGDTQAVGLQWRSEDYFQGLAFNEEVLDVGGAYVSLRSANLDSASIASLCLASGAIGNWRWGKEGGV